MPVQIHPIDFTPASDEAERCESIDVSDHHQVIIRAASADAPVLVVNNNAGNEGTPRHVYAAIARTMVDMGGVPKMSPEERRRRGLATSDESGGISYPYRGIDQIAAAAQPLFGKYGVVIIPTAIESRVDDIVIRDKPWTSTYVKVEWTIVGPAGKDDWFGAVSEGLGRDNSDKGYNKAITGAFKNLLLRLLCVGDPADDPDQEKHVDDRNVSGRAAPPAPPRTDDEGEARTLITGMDRGQRLRFVADFYDQFGALLNELDEDRLTDALHYIRAWLVSGNAEPTKQVEDGPGHAEPLTDAADALADAADAREAQGTLTGDVPRDDNGDPL